MKKYELVSKYPNKPLGSVAILNDCEFYWENGNNISMDFLNDHWFKPLDSFITSDGFKIYKGEEFYIVLPNKTIQVYKSIPEDKNLATFKNKENAEEAVRYLNLKVGDKIIHNEKEAFISGFTTVNHRPSIIINQEKIIDFKYVKSVASIPLDVNKKSVKAFEDLLRLYDVYINSKRYYGDADFIIVRRNNCLEVNYRLKDTYHLFSFVTPEEAERFLNSNRSLWEAYFKL